MQLLTAPDDEVRWTALIAGTHEVLDRLDHITAPQIFCPTGQLVIDRLVHCVSDLRDIGATMFANWLAGVVDVLTAHEQLKDECANSIRRAGTDDEVIAAMSDAARSLDAAAQHIGIHSFGAFPSYAPTWPDYDLIIRALACVADESRRPPLRQQLDGAGGAAGSREFNPYVASLYSLELATHRRIYRLFYRFAAHCGMVFEGDDFETPELVDRRDL